jgi:transposase
MPGPATSNANELSAVSPGSPGGELHFEVHETGIKKEQFLEFCEALGADVGRPVFLILDNSQVHRAKTLKEYTKQSNGMLTIFFIPPYSPDLNPG